MGARWRRLFSIPVPALELEGVFSLQREMDAIGILLCISSIIAVKEGLL
jgi:hypothetical protein